MTPPTVCSIIRKHDHNCSTVTSGLDRVMHVWGVRLNQYCSSTQNDIVSILLEAARHFFSQSLVGRKIKRLRCNSWTVKILSILLPGLMTIKQSRVLDEIFRQSSSVPIYSGVQLDECHGTGDAVNESNTDIGKKTST
jgi:hypothetical protein